MNTKWVVQCVLAVCVLVIGIYIVYKLIQFCNEYLPPLHAEPPDNPNPTVSNVTFSYFVVGVAGPTQAAPPAATPVEQSPATIPCDCGCWFELQVAFTNGLPVILGGNRPDLITKAAFVADLTALGFVSQYRNVQGDPNVTFTNGVVTVAGGAPVAVSIEQSFDLTNWTAAFRTVVPQDRILSVTLPGQPCTNASFYRVRVE